MTVTKLDREFLKIAVEEARLSRDVHPSGAYLVTSTVNHRAHNELPEGVVDYTYRRAHPYRQMYTACAEETVVLWHLRSGANRLGDGTLYSSHLPCPLCARLVSLAGVRRVVYASAATNLGRLEQDATRSILKECGVELECAEESGDV